MSNEQSSKPHGLPTTASVTAASGHRSRGKAKSQADSPAMIEGVPTAKHLITLGLAEHTATGHIHISSEGHALLGEKLRANATEALQKGIWHGVKGKYAQRH